MVSLRRLNGGLTHDLLNRTGPTPCAAAHGYCRLMVQGAVSVPMLAALAACQTGVNVGMQHGWRLPARSCGLSMQQADTGIHSMRSVSRPYSALAT